MKNKILKVIIVLVILAYTTSCDEDDDILLPSISSTTSNVNIEKTYTSIKISGNITSNGGAEITARGVAWSTNPNPTINDNKTVEVNNTFTSTISDLTVNTIYYFRVYATNSAGTEYGTEQNFNTLSLGGTTWDYNVMIDGLSAWHADVTFNADGSTFYTEPDSPGIFDFIGTWNLDGNTLTYIIDPNGNLPYTFIGEIVSENMGGTWQFNGTQNWTATEY